MKKQNIEKLRNMASFDHLPNGNYVCVIRNVEDVQEKEYLRYEFDICEGEYAGYFKALHDKYNNGYWAGIGIISYKDSAEWYFGKFVVALEQSNPGFHFDGETESDFIGKTVGLCLVEKEYTTARGNVGTRMEVSDFLNIEDVRKEVGI